MAALVVSGKKKRGRERHFFQALITDECLPSLVPCHKVYYYSYYFNIYFTGSTCEKERTCLQDGSPR